MSVTTTFSQFIELLNQILPPILNQIVKSYDPSYPPNAGDIRDLVKYLRTLLPTMFRKKEQLSIIWKFNNTNDTHQNDLTHEDIISKGLEALHELFIYNAHSIRWEKAHVNNHIHILVKLFSGFAETSNVILKAWDKIPDGPLFKTMMQNMKVEELPLPVRIYNLTLIKNDNSSSSSSSLQLSIESFKMLVEGLNIIKIDKCQVIQGQNGELIKVQVSDHESIKVLNSGTLKLGAIEYDVESCSDHNVIPSKSIKLEIENVNGMTLDGLKLMFELIYKIPIISSNVVNGMNNKPPSMVLEVSNEYDSLIPSFITIGSSKVSCVKITKANEYFLYNVSSHNSSISKENVVNVLKYSYGLSDIGLEHVNSYWWGFLISYPLSCELEYAKPIINKMQCIILPICHFRVVIYNISPHLQTSDELRNHIIRTTKIVPQFVILTPNVKECSLVEMKTGIVHLNSVQDVNTLLKIDNLLTDYVDDNMPEEKTCNDPSKQMIVPSVGDNNINNGSSNNNTNNNSTNNEKTSPRKNDTQSSRNHNLNPDSPNFIPMKKHVLVENHPMVSFGDIAICIGRIIHARVGRIEKAKENNSYVRVPLPNANFIHYLINNVRCIKIKKENPYTGCSEDITLRIHPDDDSLLTFTKRKGPKQQTSTKEILEQPQQEQPQVPVVPKETKRIEFNVDLNELLNILDENGNLITPKNTRYSIRNEFIAMINNEKAKIEKAVNIEITILTEDTIIPKYTISHVGSPDMDVDQTKLNLINSLKNTLKNLDTLEKNFIEGDFVMFRLSYLWYKQREIVRDIKNKFSLNAIKFDKCKLKKQTNEEKMFDTIIDKIIDNASSSSEVDITSTKYPSGYNLNLIGTVESVVKSIDYLDELQKEPIDIMFKIPYKRVIWELLRVEQTDLNDHPTISLNMIPNKTTEQIYLTLVTIPTSEHEAIAMSGNIEALSDNVVELYYRDTEEDIQAFNSIVQVLSKERNNIWKKYSVIIREEKNKSLDRSNWYGKVSCVSKRGRERSIEALTIIQNAAQNKTEQTKETIKLEDWVHKRILYAEPEHLRGIAKMIGESVFITLNTTEEEIVISGPKNLVDLAKAECRNLLSEKLKLTTSLLPSQNTMTCMLLTTENSEFQKSIQAKHKVRLEIQHSPIPVQQFFFGPCCKVRAINEEIIYAKNPGLMIVGIDSDLNSRDQLSGLLKHLVHKFEKSFEEDLKKIILKNGTKVGDINLITPRENVTFGYNWKGVILITVPKNRDGTNLDTQKEKVNQIGKYLYNALTFANENQYKTVTLPAIGGGPLGFLPESLIHTLTSTIIKWIRDNQKSSIKEITFCDIKTEYVDIFKVNLMKECFFSRSNPPKTYYDWKWTDDNNQLNLYDEISNIDLEIAYQCLGTNLEEWITCNSQRSINFVNFTQKNLLTKKIRSITRTPINRDDNPTLTSLTMDETVISSFFLYRLSYVLRKLYKKSLQVKIVGRVRDIEKAKNDIQSHILPNIVNQQIALSQYVSISDQAKLCALGYAMNIYSEIQGNMLNVYGIKKKVEMYCKEILPIVTKGIEFPVYWQKSNENLVCDVIQQGLIIYRNTVERQEVIQRFKQTLNHFTIVSVTSIENKWLYERYYVQKILMEKKNKNRNVEKRLFHGTSKTPPEVIYNGQDGFDPKFANDGMWGRGTYFATNASYSDMYAYQIPGTLDYQMFYADVLIGYSAECPPDKNMRMAPLMEDTHHIRYDSVTAKVLNDVNYVVYDTCRAYPSFLITYRRS